MNGTEGKTGKILGIGRGKIGEDALYMQTPTTGSGYPADQHHNEAGSVASGSVVSGAARDTLIALNNMGRRPGYKNLGGSDGRETPTSLRTLGSAGQTWLGAAAKQDTDVRFKGRRRNESVTSGSDHTSSGAHLMPNRSQPMRSSALANQPERDEEYGDEGIGMDIYSSNMRTEAERRAADLRRSASVASSGILDRIPSSPPPAVPELPPLSAQGSYMSSNNNSSRGGMRSASPTPQTDNASVYSASDAYSSLTLATRVRHPYGRGNSMLVSSDSSAHSGRTATTGLRPPPVRTTNEERERERNLRERERAEKEREAARDRKNQRYSPPPPEYASPSTTQPQSQQPWAKSQGGSLQRQGTRHGDIPITIEGGFGGEFESESQESHSNAYGGSVTQANVAQRNAPGYPPQHVRNDSAMGSGSTTLSVAKRVLPTEHNVRSYTPDRMMAVPSDRSHAPNTMGRPSEDRVWTLDGVATVQKNVVGRPIIDDRTRVGMGSDGRRVSRVPAPKQ